MVPPGDYVQEIVVRGTLDMLLADIKQSLTLGNQGQRAVIYQPDGQRVRSLKEMQDGQTVYMTQKVIRQAYVSKCVDLIAVWSRTSKQ